MKKWLFGLTLLVFLLIGSQSFAKPIKVIAFFEDRSHAVPLKSALEITLRHIVEMQAEHMLLIDPPEPSHPDDFESFDWNQQIFSFFKGKFAGRDDIVYWIVTRIHNRADGSRWLSIDFRNKKSDRLAIGINHPPRQQRLLENVLIERFVKVKKFFSMMD